MNTRICLIEDCGRRRYTNGYCAPHFKRYRAHGDPLAGGPIKLRASTPEESFVSRVRAEGDCLVWTGSTAARGYGLVWLGNRHDYAYAHRYAWERKMGPVPDGVFIDHICHNRACVNTDHLRLATHRQNQQNRSGATSHSLTQVRGVVKVGNRYRARVKVEGIGVHCGYFDTREEAGEAAATLRQRVFGEYAGKS